MSDNIVAYVSLRPIEGSQARFEPKRIPIVPGETVILGRSGGLLGPTPLPSPTNGCFQSFEKSKAGSRPLDPRHAALYYDEEQKQVIVRNLGTHYGSFVFRGVPDHNEAKFITIRYDEVHKHREETVMRLEEGGDWAVLRDGDILQLGCRQGEPSSDERRKGTHHPVCARVAVEMEDDEAWEILSGHDEERS